MPPESEFQKYLTEQIASTFGVPKHMHDCGPMSSAVFQFSGDVYQWRLYSEFISVWSQANYHNMPEWLGDARQAVASHLAQAYWDFTEAMARIR